MVWIHGGGFTVGSGAFCGYGAPDQQAALRRVRDSVAVFGESADGGSVCHQRVSPRTAGLLDRAVAQSGCGFTPAPGSRSVRTVAGDGDAFRDPGL